MKLKDTVAGRIRTVVQRHGILGTLVLALRSVGSLLRDYSPARRREWQRQLAFDRTYGVDTTLRVPSSALQVGDGVAALHAVGYQPTSVEALHKILQSIPVPYEEYTFIDVGAGKGRALLVGSHYPFRKIIGIELSPRLVAIANRNIATYRDPAQKCHAIECICADASVCTLPADGNLLLYLYNPFGEPIMRGFLQQVGRAVQSGDRQIWLAYANATLRHVLDEMPFLSPAENEIGLCLYRARAFVPSGSPGRGGPTSMS